MYYTFIEFIILLYIFLVISFARYKEYMIFLISFSQFSDVLAAFTCARPIANFRCTFLGVKIFNPFPYDSFDGSIPILKAVNSPPS